MLVVLLFGVGVALIAGVVAASCHPPEPVPPGPDAQDSSRAEDSGGGPNEAATLADAGDRSMLCVAACAALVDAGCAEGTSPSCASTLTRIESDRIVRTPCAQATCPPLACAAIALVRTRAQAQALGLCSMAQSPPVP